MQLELISFKLCAFTQRSIIALNAQNIDFKLTSINPMDPPDWFLAISPTGQVPLLKADDEIIFESDVIGEFINDISPHSLHPIDTLKKASNRSWIAFSASMFKDLFTIVTGDEAQFSAAKSELFAKLAKVEAVKTKARFFNNDTFNMIDIAFAPLFMRLKWINKFTNNTMPLDKLPKLTQWAIAILSEPAVKNSVAEGLDEVYYSKIKAFDGHLSTLLID